MNNTSTLQPFYDTLSSALYATARTCLTDVRAQCIIAGAGLAIRGIQDTIAAVNEPPQDGWRNRATRWVRIATNVATTCAGVTAAATGILGYTDYSPFPPNKPKENEDDCSTDFRLDADPDCPPKETDLDPCLSSSMENIFGLRSDLRITAKISPSVGSSISIESWKKRKAV